MNEFNENMTVEMHVSQIRSIFMGSGDRFYTFQEVANEIMKKAPAWANFNSVSPALEVMLTRRQLEYDPKNGYCLFGSKERLLHGQLTPSMSRSDFDRLPAPEKLTFCNNGGKVF